MEQLLVGAFLVLAQLFGGASAQAAAVSNTLTGTCDAQTPKVTLSWQAYAGGNSNSLQRGSTPLTPGSTCSQTASYFCFLPNNKNQYTYTDTDIKKNVKYEYRVKVTPSDFTNSFFCDTTASAPASTKPSVSTASPSLVTQTTATLRGSVNPNGGGTTAWFEYGTTQSFGSQTESESVAAGTQSVSLAAFAGELEPGTRYYYRLVAENSAGSTNGNTVSFTTQQSSSPPPTGNPACSDGADNDGDGLTDYPGDPGCTSSNDTSEYNAPAPPAATSTLTIAPPSKSAGIGDAVLLKAYYDPDGSSTASPTQEVTGLVNWISTNTGAVAHQGNGVFKAVGSGSATIRATYQGLTAEAAVNVYLPAGKPLAKTTAATNVSQAFATLEGLANPNGALSQAWFEYGPSESLGTLTEKKPVGSSRSWQEVTAEVRLTPGTEYYYRIVVQSSVGTARGEILKMSSAGNPALELDPATREIKVGETAAFKAYYDSDGSGPEARREVTAAADWLSSDNFVAFHERNGEFRARGPGEVIVSALYNPSGRVTNIYDLENLKAEGGISVARTGSDGGFDLGSIGEQEEPEKSAPSSGVGWRIVKWIFWILVIGGVITVAFIFVRRKFQEAEE